MVDKTRIVPILKEKLQDLPAGHCIDIRTYKRNRSVLFVKKTDKKVLIIQDGFEKIRFEITLDKLKKHLTVILKKEFPRSNKIRLYSLGPFDKEQHEKQKRKVL